MHCPVTPLSNTTLSSMLQVPDSMGSRFFLALFLALLVLGNGKWVELQGGGER